MADERKPDLAKLERRIRAIESGEEEQRIRRMLETPEDLQAQTESSLRSQLAVLSTEASREHLLSRLRAQAKALRPSPPQNPRRSTPHPHAEIPPARPPKQDPEFESLTLGDGLIATLASAFWTVVGLFAVAVLAGVFNANADDRFDASWLLRAAVAAAAITAYTALVPWFVRSSAGPTPTTWTVLIASGLYAIPIIWPIDWWISLLLVFSAAALGAVVLWLGNRHRPYGFEAQWPLVPYWATIALLVAVAGALVLAPDGPNTGGLDPTPEKLDGTPSYEFEQDDLERAAEASDGVKEYCSGAVSEAQRIGCESHVTEADIP